MGFCSLLSCFRGSSRPRDEPFVQDIPATSDYFDDGVDVYTQKQAARAEKQISLPPLVLLSSFKPVTSTAVNLLDDTHPSVVELRKQERTLRALLDKAQKFGHVPCRSVVTPSSSRTPSKLYDPDVSRMNDQLLQCCSEQRPGAGTFDRVTLLLAELRSWLSSATSDGSAIVLLYVSGEALARSEHMARSAGQVKFWPASAVHALVALVQTYGALMAHCPADPLPTPANTQCRSQAPGVSFPSAAFSAALVQMLVRADLVELLVEVLQLVHFDKVYAAGCEKHVPVSTAMSLWRFLRDLVRFAGVHAGTVDKKHMAGCMEQLARLLSPVTGIIPRLLAQPLSGENLAVQHNVLLMLQQLFDAPQAVVEQLFRTGTGDGNNQHQGKGSSCSSSSGSLPSDAAGFYTSYHLREAARCYYAADGDALSACAELSVMHLRLLRSLVHSNTPAVLSAVHRVGAVNLFLGEIALQFDAADVAPVDEQASSEDVSSQDSGDDMSSAAASLAAPERRAVPQKPFSGKFEFSYDLNEDLERIMELEDQLGSAVPLEGFDYDEEGRQMLKRNEQMAQQQAAEAAVEWKEEDGSDRPSSEAKEGASKELSMEPPSASRCVSRQSSRGRPGIPKLSFLTMSRSAVSRTPSITSRSPSAAPSQRASTNISSARLSAPRPPLNPGTLKDASACAPPLLLDVSCAGGDISSSSGLPSQQWAQRNLTPLSPLGPLGSDAATAVGAPGAGVPQPVQQIALPQISPSKRTNRKSRLSTETHLTAEDKAQLESLYAQYGDGLVTAVPPVAGLVILVRPPRGQGGSPRARSLSRDDTKSRDSAPASTSAIILGRAIPSLPRAQMIPALDFSILAGSTSNRASARGPATASGRQKICNSSRHQASCNTGNGNSRVPDSAMTSTQDRVGGGGTMASRSGGPGTSQVASQGTCDLAQPRWAHEAAVPTSGRAICHAATHQTVPDSCRDLLPHQQDNAAIACLPPREANRRLLVTDARCSIELLRLSLELLITSQGGLEPAYWMQYPLDQGKLYNLEYMLTWHLSAGPGVSVVPELVAKLEASRQAQRVGVRAAGAKEGAVIKAAASGRLLRLLSRGLFDEGRFSELKFHARGASGSVFRAKMMEAGVQQQVMIKTIDLPSSKHDRCVVPDIYGEVSILERYKGCHGICQIIDYGLAPEAFWIVMTKYRCSLAEWRQRQATGPPSATAAVLLISILAEVVEALQVLARDSVVHFDLKCSNVLVDPLPGVQDTELYNPLAASPARTVAPFHVVLADFGEARSYRSAEEAFTVRNRGTEVYKSPEMLMLNNGGAAGGKDGSWMVGGSAQAGTSSPGRLLSPTASGASAAAKAALQGAGLASDVWSLGCLAYELLSGVVLFGGDYASVTHRVAFGGHGNLQLTDPERAALGDRDSLVDLVQWVLARDPAKRPSLAAIAACLGKVQEQLRMEASISSVQETQ